MKSPLYLTENLLGGQLPHVLWCSHVGLQSQKKERKEKKRKSFSTPQLQGCFGVVVVFYFISRVILITTRSMVSPP
jgi:hypothetical protein